MITGTITATCPGCGRDHDVRLVQSINAGSDAAEKQRLLAGELNVLACECGRRTQLEASVLYADPEHEALVRVVPGGDETAMSKAAIQFRAAGAIGIQRLVPSMNALVEKVKILDAGLADWAVEMIKVLLLSTLGDLDRVLLFDRLDGAELRWVLFGAAGQLPKAMASPRDAYERLSTRDASRPGPDDFQIDRAWAVDAVQAMIATAN